MPGHGSRWLSFGARNPARSSRWSPARTAPNTPRSSPFRSSIALLDPAQLAGTVILVPLVNVASFEQKVPHVNPVDGKSMNRFYPGKADGTQTERALFL